ncbi:hypothetical protein HY633_04875 [Candidatus Uhrbacteria bacterium]|nr:hypothetical protein [Candidatus Uhrbacteria bacterium]
MPSSRPSSASNRPFFAWQALAVEEAAFAVLFGLSMAAARRGPLVPSSMGEVSVLSFLALFAAVTVLVVVLIRALHSAKLVAAMFDAAMIIGVANLLWIFFGPSAAVLGAAGAAVIRYAVPRIVLLDAVLLLGLAGVTAELSTSLRPTGIAVILAVLAVYDIIAVYGTRHMVEMAGALLRQRAVFAIIVPSTAKGWLAPFPEARPGGGFTFLGTGDAVLPALLVAAVAREQSVAAATVVGLGAALGLACTHFLFASARHVARERRDPMPALPPIATGALLGYLFTFLT